MPRYFFHVAGNGREPDDEGMILPDAAAARIAGISYAGSLLHNEPVLLAERGEVRIEIAEATGRALCAVVARLVDAG